MTYRIAIFLLGLSGFVPGLAVAANTTPPSYEVEVLVFQTNLPDQEGGELWTNDTVKPVDTKGAVPASTVPAGSALAATAERLNAGGRFQVVLHKRWIQVADAKEKTKPILLATNDKMLNGLLRVYINRFLYVELGLDFQPLLIDPNGLPAPVYQIQDQRRIKSQELNYFDHPKFGAIVRVVPIS
jgi:hypothetical protein